MKDISDKITTLRVAVAEAFLQIDAGILASVDGGRKTDKGDAIEVSRVAGAMAAKKTWETIPFCHPIPITYANVDYWHEPDGIRLQATVKTMAATGVEIEALTAASTAALTLYDMLKPHAPSDTGVIEIRSIHLVSKSGGKSDFKARLQGLSLRVAVVVVSEAVKSGEKSDEAAKNVLAQLQKHATVEQIGYEIIGEDPAELRSTLETLLAKGVDLLITLGGTGLTAKDQTADVLEPMLDKTIPGIMEFARSHGLDRSPRAMLSRSLAGTIGETLILAIPGSKNGAKESCEALFPGVLHYFESC